eukprot:m.35235 g.35235  ORF g.35235 m.35235 type:complete len:572 (-) comp9865_c1_seq1:101-1816(-)
MATVEERVAVLDKATEVLVQDVRSVSRACDQANTRLLRLSFMRAKYRMMKARLRNEYQQQQEQEVAKPKEKDTQSTKLNAREQARMSQYKSQTLLTSSWHDREVGNLVQSIKQWRLESRNKPRNVTVAKVASPIDPVPPKRVQEKLKKAMAKGVDKAKETEKAAQADVEQLQSYVRALSGDGRAPETLSGLQSIRRLLSRERNPPIDMVISTGCIPRMIQMLNASAFPQRIVLEAAWALTNIASGTSAQTQVCVDAGVVPPFVELLKNPKHPDTLEQAIWGLGNIIGDGPNLRDFVLNCGIVPNIINLLNSDQISMSLRRNATWCLSNCCRGKPPPRPEIVMPSLPLLVKLLSIADSEVRVDAAWAISYLSDSQPRQAAMAGCVPPLMKMLQHVPNEQTPALRSLGNLLAGDAQETQCVIDGGFLAFSPALLQSPKQGIRKEVCWSLSNIAAGTRSQITALIASGCVPAVVHILQTDDARVRKEAAWVIANVCDGGSDEHVMYMLQHGAFDATFQYAQQAQGDRRMMSVCFSSFARFIPLVPAANLPLGLANFVEDNADVDKAQEILDMLD